MSSSLYIVEETTQGKIHQNIKFTYFHPISLKFNITKIQISLESQFVPKVRNL